MSEADRAECLMWNVYERAWRCYHERPRLHLTTRHHPSINYLLYTSFLTTHISNGHRRVHPSHIGHCSNLLYHQMAHWSQCVLVTDTANWIGHTTNPDGSIPGVTASMVCPFLEMVVERRADDRLKLYILLSRMYHWPISFIIFQSLGLLKLPLRRFLKGVSYLLYVLSSVTFIR